MSTPETGPTDGGPAYPAGEAFTTTDPWGGVLVHRKGALHDGMSLRDYFAAHAPPMPSPWFNESVPPGERHMPSAWLRAEVQWRLAYADAMLAERNRRP